MDSTEQVRIVDAGAAAVPAVLEICESWREEFPTLWYSRDSKPKNVVLRQQLDSGEKKVASCYLANDQACRWILHIPGGAEPLREDWSSSSA